jgi:hypothetical protein
MDAERVVVVVPDPPLVRAPARKLRMISFAAESDAAFSARFVDNYALDETRWDSVVRSVALALAIMARASDCSAINASCKWRFACLAAW